MSIHLWRIVGGLALLAACAPASAQRTISAAEYHDRLRGMWFGELVGNYAGRATEGQYNSREAAPDSVFVWVLKTSDADPWQGDDDTNFEYLYLHCLETCGLNPTPVQIRQEWLDHVTSTGIYIANLQAYCLLHAGYLPPDTGAWRYNLHAWAIDAQITTEAVGACAPGMRQWAIDRTADFATVTNEGFPVHAAQFYAAMYAAAAYESDVETLVALGQAALPTTSRSWQVIQDVRDWYAADQADGTLDWRETRRQLWDDYVGANDFGRFRYWVESTMNLGLTTLALLYGQGDFEETVRIGVLAGFDNDCNPATAGGLIGLIQGYSNLPTSVTTGTTDVYQVAYRTGLPAYDTITGIATRLQAVAEQVIVAQGGSVAGGIYTLPGTDSVVPLPALPEPSGPGGLVATVRAAGGTVTTCASVETHDPTLDRHNLDQIADGIVDIRHSGRLAYTTDDGMNAQPAGGDYYGLVCSVPVRFEQVVFYEGDAMWLNINGDPRLYGLRGGYFTDLTVEVRQVGVWQPVAGLTLSEPFDPFAFYQVITLDFAALPGDAVRIRGTAGGRDEYTSILELEVHGARLGDADADGDVDADDWAAFEVRLHGPDHVPTPDLPTEFDADADADCDLIDLAWFGRAFGRT